MQRQRHAVRLQDLRRATERRRHDQEWRDTIYHQHAERQKSEHGRSRDPLRPGAVQNPLHYNALRRRGSSQRYRDDDERRPARKAAAGLLHVVFFAAALLAITGDSGLGRLPRLHLLVLIP
jgi:hypothetical protein